MEHASAMESDRNDREALRAAGYTTPRGAVLLCLVLAVLGAFFGSIAIALFLSFALPANSHAENVALGTAAGVALGVWIGVAKVRRGNLEAREEVEDREWRRLVRNEHFNRPQ